MLGQPAVGGLIARTDLDARMDRALASVMAGIHIPPLHLRDVLGEMRLDDLRVLRNVLAVG